MDGRDYGHERSCLAVWIDFSDEAPKKLVERAFQDGPVGGLPRADKQVEVRAEVPPALPAPDSADDLQRRRVVDRRDLEVVIAVRDLVLEGLGDGLSVSGLKSRANSFSEK